MVYFCWTALTQRSKPIFQKTGTPTPAGGQDWSEGTGLAERRNSRERRIPEAEEERGGRLGSPGPVGGLGS